MLTALSFSQRADVLIWSALVQEQLSLWWNCSAAVSGTDQSWYFPGEFINRTKQKTVEKFNCADCWCRCLWLFKKLHLKCDFLFYLNINRDGIPQHSVLFLFPVRITDRWIIGGEEGEDVYANTWVAAYANVSVNTHTQSVSWCHIWRRHRTKDRATFAFSLMNMTLNKH